MTKSSGDNWQKTITINNKVFVLYYNISAKDVANNWNDTGLKNITILDNDKPMIINVQTIPPMQYIGGNVNISATVIDNIGVDEVYLVLEYPANISHRIVERGNPIENISIT